MIEKVMIFMLWILFSHSSHAEEVRVGSVMNFIPAAQDIVRLFEKQTMHTVKLTFKRSGQLAHIARERQGLDVILLGDLNMALNLENEGLLAKNARFTNAIGKLALYRF